MKIVANDPVVKSRIIHPLGVELVDCIRANIEDLSDLSKTDPWTFVLEAIFIGIEFIEFLCQQFQCPFGDYLLLFL